MIKNIQSQSITLVMFLLCIFCKAQNNELLYETYYESDMIKKLPEKVFKMPNLKTVSIHIPSDSAAQVIFKQLEKVKPFQVLHVTGGNFNYFSALGYISVIPENVNKLTQLYEVDFSGNALKEINIDPTKLRDLRNIYLFRNKFTQFPKILLKFNNLKEIGLENNYIKEIPKEVCDKPFESLYFGRNQLQEIPECLFEMKTLKNLFINENPISETLLQNYKLLANKNINLKFYY